MPYRDVSNARKVVAQAGNLTENLTYLGMEKGVVFTTETRMSFGLDLTLVSAARATPDVRLDTRDRIINACQGVLPVGAVVRYYTETRPATKRAVDAFAPVDRGGTPLQRMLEANHGLYERMRRAKWVSETAAYLTVTLPVPGRPKRTPFLDGSEKPFVEKAVGLQQRLMRQLALSGMRAEPMDDRAVWGRITDYWNPSQVSAEKSEYRAQLDGADLAAVQVNRTQKNKGPKARRFSVPTMRAQVACSDVDLDHDGCFMLGAHRVAIVSFLKPTRSTHPGCTEGIIAALGGTHSTFLVEFTVVDAATSRARLNDSLEKQETAAGDPTMKAGREIYTRISAGNEVLQQIETGNVLTEMAMHATIYTTGPDSRDELDDRVERVLAAFAGVGGCMPRVANTVGIELFLENAPFMGRSSSYQVGAYLRNAADSMPQTGAWRGSPTGVLPLRSRNGTLLSITPVGQKNRGVVVMGSSGEGKSVAISMLAAGLVHRHDAALTVVDPKPTRDYMGLFLSLGAGDAVVSIRPGAVLPDGRRLCINPFDLQPGLHQPDAEKADGLMELFGALRVHSGSGDRRNVLLDAIRLFYIRFSTPTLVGGEEVDVYTGRGTMSDFADVAARLNTVAGQPVLGNPDLLRAVREVGQELRAFTGNTVLGQLLDGHTTVNLLSKYLYLDVSGMMNSTQMQQVGMLLVNDLVWNRSQRLEGDKVTVLEEAGVAKDLPGLVPLTDRLFKMGRALGMIPILAMQEVGDALAYKGVINNASTRILLRSLPKERAQVAEIFELNDAMRALHTGLGGEDGRFRELLILQDGAGNTQDGDVGQLWLSREAYWMSTSVETEAKYRRQVAWELYGGDEARAAIRIAQEEQHAA